MVGPPRQQALVGRHGRHGVLGDQGRGLDGHPPPGRPRSIDYDAPVAEYWPEFGANGKAQITVRDVMRHRAGLAHLRGVRKRELLDHLHMEERIAAAPVGRHFGKPAYHAITYGWLLSGLARAVTGIGMRELFRIEVAEPLNTDGLHLGRPPAGAPTHAARIIGPQHRIPNPVFNAVAPRIAALEMSAIFGSMYFPGMRAAVQGDMPLLDSELPSANGVATARSLARMYGAIANGGEIDGRGYVSAELVAGLTSRPAWPGIATSSCRWASTWGTTGSRFPVRCPDSGTSAWADRWVGRSRTRVCPSASSTTGC